MRDRFKFLRRPPRGTSSAAKRMRIDSEDKDDEIVGNGDEPYGDEDFDKDVKVIAYI